MSAAEESPWSHLPVDILETIAARLNNNDDEDALSVPFFHNLRLRSVCKSWRSSISPPIPPNPPNNILPFPISHPYRVVNPNLSGHFTLSLTTIYLLQQPPQQQSSSSSITNPNYWLLRVESGSARNTWHPLNPLHQHLSRYSKLPEEFPKSINLLDFRVSQVATSYIFDFVDYSRTHNELDNPQSPPRLAVSNSGPLAAMAITGLKLVYCRCGDERWRAVDYRDYCDVTFYNGKFYAIGIQGRTISIDGQSWMVSEIVPSMLFHADGGDYLKKLVESNGELLLVVWLDEKKRDEDVQVGIYRLNEERREWERVNDLGDQVLFIGDDCSYSISARDFPGLISNCVYFGECTFFDLNVDKQKLGVLVGETGVYCLGDGRCGALGNFHDRLPLFWPPPSWLNPKHL